MIEIWWLLLGQTVVGDRILLLPAGVSPTGFWHERRLPYLMGGGGAFSRARAVLTVRNHSRGPDFTAQLHVRSGSRHFVQLGRLI